MRRVLGIVVRASIAVVLALVVAAGGWAAWGTYWNPTVAVRPPLRSHRPGDGLHASLTFGGDFGPVPPGDRWIRRRGRLWPYGPTARMFQQADLAFANLETPITESRDRFPLPKAWIYKIDPSWTTEFQWLGLDVLSIANNHVSDYRDRGVVDTVRTLRRAAILPLGAGVNEPEARRGAIVDVGGLRIGFVGYLEDRTNYGLYYRSYAIGGTTGCARLVASDVTEDVRRLRRLSDFVVASVHWGDNYTPTSDHQRSSARLLADAGVDLIVGHHPHDVQEAAWIGHTLVLYSIGNWAWGALGSKNLRVGLVARVRIARGEITGPARLETVDLVPLATQNRLIHYRARPLRQDERAWLIPFLQATRAAGTEVREGATLRLPLP